MAQILGGLEPYEVNTTGLTTVTCDHKITTDNKYYVGFEAFYSQNCYVIFLKQ